MTKLKLAYILALFVSALTLTDCGGDGANANIRSSSAANGVTLNPNSPKTNVEELGVLINIPYEADDVVWKGGLAQKKVTAVFRFAPEDVGKIIAEIQKSGAGEPVNVSTETWFPDELTARSDMSGGNPLKGTAYPAAIFYQEPFTNGKVTHIDVGDYFIVELTAK